MQKLTRAEAAGQLSPALLLQVASKAGDLTPELRLPTWRATHWPACQIARPKFEARRRGAEEQLDGIKKVVENFGDHVKKWLGSVENRLKASVKQSVI